MLFRLRMPPPPPRKRPWYLVASLLAALAFGVGGGCEGYGDVAFFRGARMDIGPLLAVGNDADRVSVTETFDQWTTVLDAAKARAFPIGVAGMLVGVTIMIFAMRAMAGRTGARNALVQLVIAQVGVGIISFAMLRDARDAQHEFYAATVRAQAHEVATPESAAETDIVARYYIAAHKFVPPLLLALQAISSALIILALTRPRSREFFEATADPAIE